MFMESETTPEVVINPLGLELTQKITEMLRHPKSDIDAAMLEEIHVFDGADTADELRKYDRTLLGAYYEPDSRITAYLQMPEPGSPQLNDSVERWEIFIKVPSDAVGDSEIVKTFLLEVDETNHDVVFTQNTLVYVDGELQSRPAQRPRFDPNDIEQSLHAYFEAKRADKEFAHQLGLNDYTHEYHVQIMEILNSFSAENEVLSYDPANGRGIFY